MSLPPQLWDCRCTAPHCFLFSSLGPKNELGSSHHTYMENILLSPQLCLFTYFFSDRISLYGPDRPPAHPPHAFSPGVLGFFSLPLCVFPGITYLLDAISLKKCKRIQDCRAFVATHILCCFTLLTLGVSGKVFLKPLDGGGYTHPKCGQL